MLPKIENCFLLFVKNHRECTAVIGNDLAFFQHQNIYIYIYIQTLWATFLRFRKQHTNCLLNQFHKHFLPLHWLFYLKSSTFLSQRPFSRHNAPKVTALKNRQQLHEVRRNKWVWSRVLQTVEKLESIDRRNYHIVVFVVQKDLFIIQKI